MNREPPIQSVDVAHSEHHRWTAGGLDEVRSVETGAAAADIARHVSRPFIHNTLSSSSFPIPVLVATVVVVTMNELICQFTANYVQIVGTISLQSRAK